MVRLLDSSTVVALLTADHPFHTHADKLVRTYLVQRDQLVASTVTYAEVLTGAQIGHGTVPPDRVRAFFADLVTLIDVDPQIADLAAMLRASSTPKLKTPDALIVATAMTVGADTIVTGDNDWTKVSPIAVEILVEV